MQDVKEIIIIGSGPAGLTAGIYTARANLNPLIFAGLTFGGQLMNTTEVENYPGFPEGIMGPELMQKFIAQAERFGAQIKYENVDKVDFDSKIKKVYAGGIEYQAKVVIIASGADPKWLGLPSEQKYRGRGVSSCATCDGAFYKEKVIAVVGGGDSAAEEATFLTRFGSKVYLIVRKDYLRASEIMQQKVLENKKIEVLFNSEIKEVMGDENVVTGIKVYNNKSEQVADIAAAGVFIAIGHNPNTDYLKGALELNEEGYIKVKDRTKTSIEGVFVAGDVHDHHYRQAVTASGFGCMAALDAEKWLKIYGD